MNKNPENRAVDGLGHYVETVVEHLGDRVVTADYEADEEVAIAVLTLTSRVPTVVELPLLLIWDEANGWGLRVQLDTEGDTTALAYLGHDVLPPAGEVRHFLDKAVGGGNPGSLAPPGLRLPNEEDDFERRLARLV